MHENTKCDVDDLQIVILECIRKIESCLNSECVDELEIDEVSEELNKFTPLLSLVLSKWVPEIIYSLYIRGSMGFNEIKNSFKISPRVLSDKLRILENVGIVVRKVKIDRPVRVQYELTDTGETIALALVPLLTVIKLKFRSDYLQC